MRRSRYSGGRILKTPKQLDAGRHVAEVPREHGVSDASGYNWKAKSRGMALSDSKRIKSLDEENRRFEQMFAPFGLSGQMSMASSSTSSGQTSHSGTISHLRW